MPAELFLPLIEIVPLGGDLAEFLRALDMSELSDFVGLEGEGRMEARIRRGWEKDGTETGKGRIYPRSYPRIFSHKGRD